MDIYRLDLSKEKLAALPKEERTLLLLLGHSSNEINVLQRFMLLSMNSQFSGKQDATLASAQTLILARLLAGKLYEAWELFRKRVLTNKVVADRVLPSLWVEGRQALKALKRYFGRANLINRIRNDYAFHNPSDAAIEESFQFTKPGEPLCFYMTETIGNSFYHASEIIVMQAILRQIGQLDPKLNTTQTQFNQMLKVIGGVAKASTILFTEVMGLLIEPYFSIPEKQALQEAPPPLSSLKIPYFIEFEK